jgi:hypothetical protein
MQCLTNLLKLPAVYHIYLVTGGKITVLELLQKVKSYPLGHFA